MVVQFGRRYGRRRSGQDPPEVTKSYGPVLVRLHQVHGQGSFRRAQPPDMQIMNGRHIGQAAQIRAHLVRVDSTGHAIQRQLDRLPQEVPRAVRDHGGAGLARLDAPRPAPCGDVQSATGLPRADRPLAARRRPAHLPAPGPDGGRVPAGPMSFARISTDDVNGRILAYCGDGSFTDDPLQTFGSRAVVEVPGLQDLLKLICRNGFEHHTAMAAAPSADILAEAFENYFDWEVYHH